MYEGETPLKVSEEVRRQAELCPRKFACLASEPIPCRVENCSGLDLLFCLNKQYCPYQEKFGLADYLCTCPVRVEIWQKYRL